MRFIVLCLMCFMLTETWSQTKTEIERRIDVEDVPLKAVEDLGENVKRFDKVKWYYQEDGDKKVFEAKFKQFSQRYSVEFDTLGDLANVEIIIKKRQIPKKTFESISSHLKAEFDDYKILKMQREHLGDSDNLFELIEENELESDLTIRYEVEVNAKVDKQRKLYEIVFDDDGKVFRQREVIMQSTDILDY